MSSQAPDRNWGVGRGWCTVGLICYVYASLTQTNFWEFFCYFYLVMEIHTALGKLLDCENLYVSD